MCDCKDRLDEQQKLIEQLQIEFLKLLLRVNHKEIIEEVRGAVDVQRFDVPKHPFGIPTIILIPLCLLAWFAVLYYLILFA